MDAVDIRHKWRAIRLFGWRWPRAMKLRSSAAASQASSTKGAWAAAGSESSRPFGLCPAIQANKVIVAARTTAAASPADSNPPGAWPRRVAAPQLVTTR